MSMTYDYELYSSHFCRCFRKRNKYIYTPPDIKLKKNVSYVSNKVFYSDLELDDILAIIEILAKDSNRKINIPYILMPFNANKDKSLNILDNKLNLLHSITKLDFLKKQKRLFLLNNQQTTIKEDYYEYKIIDEIDKLDIRRTIDLYLMAPGLNNLPKLFEILEKRCQIDKIYIYSGTFNMDGMTDEDIKILTKYKLNEISATPFIKAGDEKMFKDNNFEYCQRLKEILDKNSIEYYKNYYYEFNKSHLRLIKTTEKSKNKTELIKSYLKFINIKEEKDIEKQFIDIDSNYGTNYNLTLDWLKRIRFDKNLFNFENFGFRYNIYLCLIDDEMIEGPICDQLLTIINDNKFSESKNGNWLKIDKFYEYKTDLNLERYKQYYGTCSEKEKERLDNIEKIELNYNIANSTILENSKKLYDYLFDLIKKYNNL